MIALRRRCWCSAGAASLCACLAASCRGCVVLGCSGGRWRRPPARRDRVTFTEAIRARAEKNPTVAAAAASILRAEGLIRQARSATLFQVIGNVTRRRSIAAWSFEADRHAAESDHRIADGRHADFRGGGVGAARAGGGPKAVAELDVADASGRSRLRPPTHI